MLTEFDLTEWVPGSPLEYLYTIGAICSICMFLWAVWSLASRVILRLLSNVHIRVALTQIDRLVVDTDRAIDFRLHSYMLQSFVVSRMARMVSWVAFLVFVAIAIDESIFGVILALGPLSFIFKDVIRLRTVMMATYAPRQNLQVTIASVETRIGKLTSTDPEIKQVRERLLEMVSHLKAMDEKLGILEKGFDEHAADLGSSKERTLGDAARRSETGDADVSDER